jgi:hypothetical protein
MLPAAATAQPVHARTRASARVDTELNAARQHQRTSSSNTSLSRSERSEIPLTSSVCSSKRTSSTAGSAALPMHSSVQDLLTTITKSHEHVKREPVQPLALNVLAPTSSSLSSLPLPRDASANVSHLSVLGGSSQSQDMSPSSSRAIRAPNSLSQLVVSVEDEWRGEEEEEQQEGGFERIEKYASREAAALHRAFI